MAPCYQGESTQGVAEVKAPVLLAKEVVVLVVLVAMGEEVVAVERTMTRTRMVLQEAVEILVAGHGVVISGGVGRPENGTGKSRLLPIAHRN